MNSIKNIPPSLTCAQVAERLGISYHSAYRLIRSTKYAKADGRTTAQHDHRKFIPETADWSKSNITLARESGVSRERIRYLRLRLGKPKPHENKTRLCA